MKIKQLLQYHKLKRQLINKKEKYNQLGRDIQELEIMADGAFPEDIKLQWESDMLNYFEGTIAGCKKIKDRWYVNLLKQDPRLSSILTGSSIRKRTANIKTKDTNVMYQQIRDLRDMLKSKKETKH